MSAEFIGLLTVGVMVAGLFLVVLNGLRSDINGLRNQVDGFQRQLDGYREELNGFRAELTSMRRDIADLGERVARVEGLLDGLRESIRAAATGEKAAA